MKLSFLGSGKVGAATAYTAALKGLCDEMVMVDFNAEKAQGEALDMMQCQAACPQVRISSGLMADTKNSDILVISAGTPRKADEPRHMLLSRNAALIADLVKNALRTSPDSIIFMITNPLDVMTQLAYQAAGLPANRVIGMGTVLDTFRYRSHLAAAFGCDARDVDAYVVGEHGETMVPLLSDIRVKGAPLAQMPGYSDAKLEKVRRDVIAASGQVIALKGGTVFAPAVAACAVLEAIIRNSQQILPVCTYQPEYGVAVSLPKIVGKHGAGSPLALPMNGDEQAAFVKSVENIRSLVKDLQV